MRLVLRGAAIDKGDRVPAALTGTLLWESWFPVREVKCHRSGSLSEGCTASWNKAGNWDSRLGSSVPLTLSHLPTGSSHSWQKLCRLNHSTKCSEIGLVHAKQAHFYTHFLILFFLTFKDYFMLQKLAFMMFSKRHCKDTLHFRTTGNSFFRLWPRLAKL